MRSITRCLSVLLLSAWVQQVAAEQPERSPRLKFRAGPACMCNGGLDEKAIRNAERQHKWSIAREKREPAPSQENNTKGD
ncbi:MAG: hypothetical protein AB7U81_04845 [Thiohalomonadaceae bacterium]